MQVENWVGGLPDEVLRRAVGYTAIGFNVNSRILPNQIDILKNNGNKLILCFSYGCDNIPLDQAKKAGIRVAAVPFYSPSSVAEYAISSMLVLSKNIQKSYSKTKRADFRISGLECILLEDKTVGVVGTGTIGRTTARKISGLVKQVLCFDTNPANDWIASIPNAKYVDFDLLLRKSDIITIHLPLIPETRHLIDKSSIGKMKRNVIIVNTSMGEVINTSDLVDGLKSGKVFGAALDVFEGEDDFMLKDMSKEGFANHPELQNLSKMSNVILSGKIAFYTEESVKVVIAKTLAIFEGFIGKMELDQKEFVV